MEDRARKRRKRERVPGVGSYVKKEFNGHGVFIGKVVKFSDGLYNIVYEDGDSEDLENDEIVEILINVSEFDDEFKVRKKKLDDLVSGNHVEEIVREEIKLTPKPVSRGRGRPPKTPNSRAKPKPVEEKLKSVGKSELVKTEIVGKSDLDSGKKRAKNDMDEEMDIDLGGVKEQVKEVDGDPDSCSDSSESVVQVKEEEVVPLVPPPELPDSSGNVGVPQEAISYLFSVYTFLRKFSIQLYLSPFKLDDFVGSINYASSNSLFDAVHLSIMRALKRHMEMLSADGSEISLKCLRRLDWSLLDSLTWPVYLVEYLLVMGHAKGHAWEGFYSDVLDREYYSLSATKKLMILLILCEDVNESAELRTEADTLARLEEGSDIDGSANPLPPLSGPRRVHPKNSKTSVGKELDPMDTPGTNLDTKLPELNTDTTNVDQDGNSDECQLCGMDGTLVCCDGCPSAYHARCLGLSKMLIPDGLWFCPECSAKKSDTRRLSGGLTLAESFGVDPYGQAFMGTCDHLLVVNSSIGADPSSRYYNESDIPKVIRVLCSTEHKRLYLEICKGIMQHWGILEDSIFPHLEITKAEKNVSIGIIKDKHASVPLDTPDNVKNEFEWENCVSSVTSTIENGLLSIQESDCQQTHLVSTSLETVTQDNKHGFHRDNVISASDPLTSADMKSCEQIEHEASVPSGSINPDNSDLTQQSCCDRSTGLDFATCASGSNENIDRKAGDVTLVKTNIDALSMPCQKVECGALVCGTLEGEKKCGSRYMGDLFKPQSYVNQYILGDIAASSAAIFAVLASEAKGDTEVQASSNPRKIASAKMALQIKAFSSACNRFVWPNSDKKAVEVPRERCGWCLACKAPTTSKKGCFLNFAASNAIKRLTKNNAGFRPINNGEGNVSGIATYILYLAESLRSLLVGPFLSLSYRKQWRKEVKEASTCSALKCSLLQLEEHIRPVAFSPDWLKVVDDWMVESSGVQNNTNPTGATQKRPGGRRSKKQEVDPGGDDLRIVTWWRGGKLSKQVFQKGILPCSIIKRAARKGGKKKISGVYYAEGSECPKRSRRLAWRAALEMSRNTPQLALQVRYLDLHLRWNDMVQPDQTSHDNKGTDSESSAYRNALIRGKKIQEDKISYGVVFSQMHLPSRVMKNTLEVEKKENGEEIIWLYESHVPLFLITQYEQIASKDSVAPSKTFHILSKLQRKQLKAFRRDIFSYLSHREDKVGKCPCASCQNNLLVGDAVKCSVCEGYCHKACTYQASAALKEEVDYVVTCHQCYRAKTIIVDESICKTPASQIVQQSQEPKMVVAVTKPLGSAGRTETQSSKKSRRPGSSLTGKKKRSNLNCGVIWNKKNGEDRGTNFRMNNILLRGTADIDSLKKPKCHYCSLPYNPDLMYICCEECKYWFHADAVQLKEDQIFNVAGFKCCRCRRIRSPACPYAVFDPNSDIKKLRVKGPKQQNTATESESESISRSRRERAPKQQNLSTPRIEWGPEQHIIATEPGSESVSRSLIGWEITTPVPSENMEGILHMEDEIVQEEDPLVFSLESVEILPDYASDFDAEWDAAEWDIEEASLEAPQKLPVRRQVKPENEPAKQKLTVRRQAKPENEQDTSFVVPPREEEPTPFGGNFLMNSENASPPQAEWEFPVNEVNGEMLNYGGVNYENMEFEPHTYFSFNELLETDDNQLDLGEDSTNMTDDWVNSAGYSAPAPPPPFNPPQQSDIMKGKGESNFVQCGICSQTQPAPDRFCEVCKFAMHAQCSPWMESAQSEGSSSWKCGNCRDWA